MAICYPENVNDIVMYPSEREVYYALKNQLDDDVSVFYSVKWMTTQRDKVVESEADFLIFDPRYGYLVLEVKGGTSIVLKEDGGWYLNDSTGGRPLDMSPYDQAERSMRYFKDFYKEQNAFPFQGVYGYAVVFPYFRVTQPEIISYRPSACTIDFDGMKDLKRRIKEAFVLHGRRRNSRISEDQGRRFMNLVRKRIALSAAAGALIEQRQAQMERINRVQNNLIWFTQNYNQMFVKGGAGTGKTWICIKLAQRDAALGKDVLVLCTNESLKDMMAKQIRNSKVSVSTFQAWANAVVGRKIDLFEPMALRDIVDKLKGPNLKKYDSIIIDEAQDFPKEWAVMVRSLRKSPESGIYVFYDGTQNIHGRDFGDGFGIEYPPFVLLENLRNTANIYKYATTNTGHGADEILNPIEGPEPENHKAVGVGQIRSKLSDILDELTGQSVKAESIAILLDAGVEAALSDNEIGQWKLVRHPATEQDQIRTSRVEDFKGLEADVVIYVHDARTPEVLNYVAYTRARFYLYEITCES